LAGYRTAVFKMDSRAAENEARTAISDIAEEWHADLVVLGSHGQKELRKFLLGSIAEFVARHTRCAVLIANPAKELRCSHRPWEMIYNCPGILENDSKLRYIRQSVRAQRGQSSHVCSEQNL
jgi:hypothetical protein